MSLRDLGLTVARFALCDPCLDRPAREGETCGTPGCLLYQNPAPLRPLRERAKPARPRLAPTEESPAASPLGALPGFPWLEGAALA